MYIVLTGKKRSPEKGPKILEILKRKYILIPAIAAAVLAAGYLTALYSPLPFIAKWRTIYIETAMTTGDHQWLATAFIPKGVIDKVMANVTDTSEVVGGLDHLTETTAPDTEPADPPETEVPDDTSEPPETTPPPEEELDILGQKDLKVGDKDYAGYTVKINDVEQGLVVSEVVESGFRGLVMLIDDPSRVYLGTTTMKDNEGLRIRQMMAHYGAVAGINASGFSDPNDSGTGGEVMGMSYDGEFWGEYVDFYGSVLITEDNSLVVGNVKNWEKYDIRAGIQFGPVLMADGEPTIIGTGGYGLQPRTVIGQRADGVMVFLVIDGRQVGWSLGCTMEDLTKILEKYEVVNAACCDGGSSSVLAYASEPCEPGTYKTDYGEVLNRNSSANPKFGRRLPNAFLVAPKEKSTDK